MSKPVEWVDDDQRLATLCEQWQQQPCIALDTEFIRTRTFYPKIGLLQIADKFGIYLVDPLAIQQTDHLCSLMENKSVVKIIHSCSEDLEVFGRFLSTLPAPLFDTQIAAAFSGFGASISYANLIKAIRGDIIEKQETRSDWLQRPLSQSQLNYAALDVEHLIEVYETLNNKLNELKRVSWVKNECQTLIDKSAQAVDFDQYYLKVKSAWKLKPRQLAVLRDLCSWREQEARTKDMPRNHLIKDSTLLEFARVLPKDPNQFYKLRDMHPRFVSQYGETCLDIITNALADEEAYPDKMPSPLSGDQTALYKALKQKVVEIAETMSMPPEFLARKKDLEFIVQNNNEPDFTLPPSLIGWREQFIKTELKEIVVGAL